MSFYFIILLQGVRCTRSPLSYGTELFLSLASYVLQELLSQTGHYSERVRKDALTGMSELLARHPEELRRQVVITFCLGACRSVSYGFPNTSLPTLCYK